MNEDDVGVKNGDAFACLTCGGGVDAGKGVVDEAAGVEDDVGVVVVDEEDDDEDISDEIVNRVWQDIGVGQVEQQVKQPRAQMDDSQPSKRRSAARQSSAMRDTNTNDDRDGEDVATRQALAEWEQEFEMRSVGRNMKDRAGRATKDSTRKTKRKYREMQRKGDLEPERGRS